MNGEESRRGLRRDKLAVIGFSFGLWGFDALCEDLEFL